MIRLLKRRLIIPRGDTGSFSIPTIGAVKEGDIAIFGIFDPLTHQTMLMKKVDATESILTITLNSEDTINLEPRKYKWDITVYKSPIYDEDNELIGAAEVNSYYSAYKLPVCEIREVALDMNRERWRTSELTLNTNQYQVVNNLQTVYPWEKIQQNQLAQQLYNIAVDNGYEEEEQQFMTDYASTFKNGKIQLGTLENFPIPGKENYLYLDTETNSLYCYKILSLTEDISSFDTTKVRIVELNENYHLYVPIKSMAVISV